MTAKKTNWLLVWAGLFVWMYPVCAFIFAIARLFLSPVSHSLPASAFAASMSLTWTFMAWKMQQNPVSHSVAQPAREVSRPPRRWSQKAFISMAFLVVAAIGATAKIVFGHPSWLFILLSAVAVPSSMFISNFILERSNLLAALKPEQPCADV